jgi:tetratricopeptide (TPR) repeat protein
VYFSRAKAEARVALSLDPQSGQAYGALAVVAMNQDRSREAAADLARAIALDPSDASSHEWQGIALLERGQLEGALRELRTAADLDPLSVSTTAWLSSAAYLARHYDDAIAYGRQTLDLDPARADVWESIGLAYEAQGSYGRAVDAFDRYAEDCASCRADADALLAAVYAREREYAKARRVLAVAQSHAHVVQPDDLALALAAVGERRVALSWLRRMPNPFLRMQIANDSRFDALRGSLGYRERSANRPA